MRSVACRLGPVDLLGDATLERAFSFLPVIILCVCQPSGQNNLKFLYVIFYDTAAPCPGTRGQRPRIAIFRVDENCNVPIELYVVSSAD